jgi:hypothetical protein
MEQQALRACQCADGRFARFIVGRFTKKWTKTDRFATAGAQRSDESYAHFTGVFSNRLGFYFERIFAIFAWSFHESWFGAPDGCADRARVQQAHHHVDQQPSRHEQQCSPAATGAARTPALRRRPRTMQAEGYWYPDHAVYNATKDQMKAMPQFKY